MGQVVAGSRQDEKTRWIYSGELSEHTSCWLSSASSPPAHRLTHLLSTMNTEREIMIPKCTTCDPFSSSALATASEGHLRLLSSSSSLLGRQSPSPWTQQNYLFHSSNAAARYSSRFGSCHGRIICHSWSAGFLGGGGGGGTRKIRQKKQNVVSCREDELLLGGGGRSLFARRSVEVINLIARTSPFGTKYLHKLI